MKTVKCEKMMNRFLEGDRSPEVKTHLENCPDCRELANLSLAVSGERAPAVVPPELDRVVLAYAASRKRLSGRAVSFTFLLRHAAIPLAAALMICVGLTFAFRVPQNVSGSPLVRSRNQVLQNELDAVDSELLMLSSRIQDTSAQLSRTVVYTGIYEQNGAMQ